MNLTVTLTIAQDHIQDTVDAMCNMNPYDETSGMTREQWAKEQVRLMLFNQVAAYIRAKAIEAAIKDIPPVSNDIIQVDADVQVL